MPETVTMAPMNTAEPPCDLAVYIRNFNNGGAERVAHLLTGALVERGVRVMAITQEGPEADHHPLDPRVGRIVLGLTQGSRGPLAGLWNNVRRVTALRRAIRRTSARSVLSFHLENNVHCVLAGLGLPARIVISERNDARRPHRKAAWTVLRRLLYRFADCVTTNSRGNLEHLAAYVPRRKLRFIPNPLLLPPEPPPPESRAPEFLCVARFVPDKCVDILLRAFARVRAAAPDWRLRLLGWGAEEESLKALSRDLGLEDAVIWERPVADPAPFYRAAAVFVLPSRYEGMPNALLEAMSHGLPAIVTNATPGPGEMIADGENGFVVPAEDPEALAAAMIQLAGDLSLRAAFGGRQRARLAENGIPAALAVWVDVLGLKKN